LLSAANRSGLSALAAEQLSPRVYRDTLLQIRVDARETRANLAVGNAHARLKQVRGEIDERNHREGGEREAANPVTTISTAMANSVNRSPSPARRRPQ
jgi:hypothetical protein